MAKKQTKVDDFRSLDTTQLTDSITDEKLHIKKMKFSHAVNPIENPMAIRASRRKIARLLTEQSKRALGK